MRSMLHILIPCLHTPECSSFPVFSAGDLLTLEQILSGNFRNKWFRVMSITYGHKIKELDFRRREPYSC